MKKLVLLAGIMSIGFGVLAQSLDDIRNMLILQQYSKAKTEIDKFLAVEKNKKNAEGLYYKGVIYNTISHDTAKSSLEQMNLRTQAYDALLAYQATNPKKDMLAENDNNYIQYLDMYFSNFDLGAKFYSLKDYNNAFEAFKKALEVHDYIVAKGYKYTQAPVHKLDTSLVLNTAITAVQAKKEVEGAKYYQHLVDADVSGAQFSDVYSYLADYYGRTNNMSAFQATLAKARKFFPGNPLWNQMEMDLIKDDKAARLKKYEEFMAADPTDYTTHYNYAVELFNVLYTGGDDLKKETYGVTADKLTAAIEKAIALDKEISASVLMANHKYNVAFNTSYDLQMAKGNTPADIKKKAELKAKLLKQTNEAIPSAEKVIKYYDGLPTLKGSQTILYNQQIDHLIEFYKIKNDPKKVAEYKAKTKS